MKLPNLIHSLFEFYGPSFHKLYLQNKFHPNMEEYIPLFLLNISMDFGHLHYNAISASLLFRFISYQLKSVDHTTLWW